MRCNCCDRPLSDKEIVFNKEIDCYEPCSTCLEIALDAAYSTDFINNLSSEDDIYGFGSGSVEILDTEEAADQLAFSYSYGDEDYG